MPTERGAMNLIDEGISPKIFLVGNTIVDSVIENLQIAEKKSNIDQRLLLDPQQKLILMTSSATFPTWIIRESTKIF